jgi:hypothetical protein
VLIASQECACRFETTNRNSDFAGLSLGIVHWAQKPGRLVELFDCFYLKEPDELAKLFGDKPGAKHENIKKVIDHLRKAGTVLYSDTTLPPKGRKKGDSIDRDLEFARPDPGKKNWYLCFQNTLKSRLFQKLMLEFALATIRRTYDETSPRLSGRQKPKNWYAEIIKKTPDISEQALLEEFRDRAKKFWIKKKPPEDKKSEKQKQVEKQNSEGDERRRNFHLNTWYTRSDKEFDPQAP